MSGMRWLLALAVLASTGCAHAITKVSDCDRVEGMRRVECAACVVQNEADGWLGKYEYRPDADAGKRCVSKK